MAIMFVIVNENKAAKPMRSISVLHPVNQQTLQLFAILSVSARSEQTLMPLLAWTIYNNLSSIPIIGPINLIYL